MIYFGLLFFFANLINFDLMKQVCKGNFYLNKKEGSYLVDRELYHDGCYVILPLGMQLQLYQIPSL